ncbi:MAG: DUF3048 domain-containing protein [Lachnospiraceae bacterium]|nr:DUF3048 domain-containing protein [Lachnospiraceae bacterium]
MKKRMLTVAFALMLCLTGCSILPEVSPIILDGEYVETEEAPKGTKESKTSSSEEETTTVEVTPSPTPKKEEPVFADFEDEWADLPTGGEFNPITEREIKTKEPDPIDEDPMAPNVEEVDVFSQEEPEEIQVMQSFLTGEWKDVNVVNRRNIAVMFPNGYRAGSTNSSPTLTHYGLSKASIIYEAPVEGRITALMGLFEDYDGLDKLGPIGSARDYFIYDAMSFDSIFINWGMAKIWTQELINSTRIDNISAPDSGIAKPYEDAFYTDDEMILDAGKGYNGYLDVTKVKEAIETMEYNEEYRESFEQAFLFANDRIATYDNNQSVTQIWPGGNGMNAGGYGNFSDMNPHFEYDEAKHVYYRYQFGDVLRDTYNNKRVSVTNVVLKICHGEERTPNEPKYDYLAFGVHGTGECYVFTNGKMIHGTWEKSSDPSADYLYDDDGNEIVLNQGKTWVCCVWKEFSQFITYE